MTTTNVWITTFNLCRCILQIHLHSMWPIGPSISINKETIYLGAYKSWDVYITLKRIRSLNNGKFTKHLDALREGFEMNKITAADLHEIEQYDLSKEPFNVKHFGDRKKLCHRFKSLL